MWRDAHRRRVEHLEAEATAMLLGALAPILSGVASRFAVIATVADAGDAEARASLDDLAAIQTEWGYAVDQIVLPYFGGMFEAGADAAAEQVAAIRGAGVVIPAPDPELMSHAAAQYLAQTRNRFYPLGEEAWADARQQLVAGFRAGEGVDALRRRITDVVDMTAREAELLARTEVISASNMGAQARIDLMGDDAPPYRQWLSTMDGRTRPTHVAADGQVVPRGEPFIVGSARLRVPGDPSGPPAEVINCRCTVLFIDTPTALVAEGRQEGGIVDQVALAAAAGPPQVDTTTGEPHTGAMVALVPAQADAERLLVDGGEPVDALHLTLAYLGDADDIPDEAWTAMLTEAEMVAGQLGPITARVFGAAVWNTTGDTPSMVLNVGDDTSNDDRALAEAHLAGTQITAVGMAAAPEWSAPEKHRPWVAHVCLAYGPDRPLVAQVAEQSEGPITFDRLRITHGSDAYDFQLAGVTPEEDDDAMNRAELTARIEEAVAAAVAEHGGPVNITINLDAAVGDDGGGCPDGQHQMPDGSCMPDDEMPGESMDAETDGPPAQPGEHLRAVMHRQGTSTGLRNTGRVFTNMTYRDAPFAYHVQVDSSAHGGQPRVVPVGIVTRVVQTDDGDYGFIKLDLDNPEAYDHARRAVAGFDRWVSIGADETMATTTLVWPAPGEMDDPMLDEIDPNEPIEEVMPQPERIVIDGANVAELTGVSTPAQADATLEPTDELVAMFGTGVDVTAEELLASGYIVAGHRPGSTLRVRPGALAAATDVPPVQIRRGGIVYPPPAAVATDCGCGGSCGGCTDGPPSPADEALARVGALEVLTAAAHTITLPELPPAAWFAEPADVDIDGAFCVTDEGRIYGLLAPYGTNHRAWARSGGRQEAPRGNVDYAGFMGGWALTAEGKVHAGPLTIDCGHAAVHRADHQVAREHYDNACSMIGAVAVGESDRLGGVWVAGAILPGTKPEQIARALACRCSGDWQPHPDRAGWSELVACLLVPAPGFRSTHATTSYRGDALVASSVPVRHVPTAAVEAARRRAAGIAAVARLTGRTPAARVLSAIEGTR